MKIDAVELTLFSWDDIPLTRYTPGSQNVVTCSPEFPPADS